MTDNLKQCYLVKNLGCKLNFAITYEQKRRKYF